MQTDGRKHTPGHCASLLRLDERRSPEAGEGTPQLSCEAHEAACAPEVDSSNVHGQQSQPSVSFAWHACTHEALNLHTLRCASVRPGRAKPDPPIWRGTLMVLCRVLVMVSNGGGAGGTLVSLSLRPSAVCAGNDQ